MNFRSILRAASLLALAAVVILGVPPGPEAAADGFVPQPCFVPAHPLKQNQAPTLKPSPSGRPQAAPPGVGGGGMPYHDDHLAEGVLAANEEVFPRDLNVAVILVDFEDEAMGPTFEGSETATAHDYFTRVMEHLQQMYDEMSDGQLTITWTIAPSVYRMPETMAYYGDDDSLATREAELCRDAVEAADPDVDFSEFNTFMTFHAGGGQEGDIYDDSREEIWSVFFRQLDFEYWLDAPDAALGIRTADGTEQDPFYVPHMVLLPEYETQDGFVFGLMGTVAHEFGHRFGLPDLYDTTGPEDAIFADSQGIGAFGLMGSGIWNADGVFPAEMCAWSKYYVGWLRPVVIRPESVGGERLVTLPAAPLDRRSGAVRIPLGGDEYLLIENRLHDVNGNGRPDFHDAADDTTFDFWTDDYTGAEFDYFLPDFLSGEENVPTYERDGRTVRADGSGVFIWHVDESIVRDYLEYNMVNADAPHKGVDLEEADGIQDLDQLVLQTEAFGDPEDSYWAPLATSFTPESVPSSDGYHGARTGVRITDVSVPGTEMTFRLRFASPERGIGDFRAGWPRDLPGRVRDFQPLVADLNGDGVREIVLGVTDDAGFGGIVILDADGGSYLPPADGPRLLTWGRLNAEPILADLDPADAGGPELVWVSGDSLYAMRGNGVFLGPDGFDSATPVAFAVLGGDPGRIHLSTGDVDGFDGRSEVLVSAPSASMDDRTDVTAVNYVPGSGAHVLTSVSYSGTAPLGHALADADTVDHGLKEIATAVRFEGGGRLGVGLLTEFPEDGRYPATPWIYSLGDSVAFTAPVVGDLDRDGIDEIVVGDDLGYVHAFNLKISTSDGDTKDPVPRRGPPDFDSERFSELHGWPVGIGTLAGDELSLADVDGDGFLEVLVFGPGNQLYAINYNGVVDLTLPVEVPGENRFEDAYLSPLVADLTAAAGEEFLLPLPDGQVRGHDASGRSLAGWSYLGGGDQDSYPTVADLDGDGGLELITVEDVAVAFGTGISDGDASDQVVRRGRVLVRDVGPGTGAGPWPVYRHDLGRTGRAPAPESARAEVESGLLSETMVMPNPVVAQDAGIHYRIRSNVEQVTIEIFDPAGRSIRTLNGSVFDSVDNLVHWDLANDRGHLVAPGLYLARIQAEAGPEVDVEIVTFVVIR